MYIVIDKLEKCTHEFTNWDKEGFFRNEQLTIKEESTRQAVINVQQDSVIPYTSIYMKYFLKH